MTRPGPHCRLPAATMLLVAGLLVACGPITLAEAERQWWQNSSMFEREALDALASPDGTGK
ncbi:MAG: hypothetical protein HC783_17920, partial [Rhodobacteraceae bacterium]|nr:hypothetical protein [Paracoccaceae bacterium]